ncbi:hypothetical protein HCZ30_15165 [Marivivens donghaensis]|uniref:Peptidase M10 serralysin C-terminal domain-containing protein n=1 Tax=Marivivens donghaensis TaxID=1699413 RepID=A0ABX0W4I6_9RHOB|nr:calcium-binding protein [Marivivens donghaensis]NIY73768.1 hypothetical protein [Marivivens donghaensis]
MLNYEIRAGVVGANDAGHSHITDLEVVKIGGDEFLFSTNRTDGGIIMWSTNLQEIGYFAYSGTDTAGSQPDITYFEAGGRDYLLVDDNGIKAVAISENGFGKVVDLDADFSISATATFDTVTREFIVFGGMDDGSGIVRLRIDDDLTLTGEAVTSDYPDTFAGGVTDLLHVGLEGSDYLLSIASEAPGITVWEAQRSSFIKNAHTYSTDDGLWITAPTALETVDIGGVTYALLASSGSSSVTVMQVSMAGELLLTDHVIDGLETFFANTSALAVCESGEQLWVAAGGSDGVTLFILNEGRLYLIENFNGVEFADCSALEITSADDQILIYASSASGLGVTQVVVDTSMFDVTVNNGDKGGDLVLDTSGSDTLSGGSGEDIFALSADGRTDTISDFQIGKDQIDLSAWDMLRSADQLSFQTDQDGLKLGYGYEILLIKSSDGHVLTPSELAGSFIFTTHLSSEPIPTLPTPVDPVPEPQVVFEGSEGHDTLIGNALNNIIRGFDGDDVLAGLDGHDRLFGGKHSDTLKGGNGDDKLTGNGGADVLIGGSGVDTIKSGGGADLAKGGGQSDTLFGQKGDDVLRGQGGDDTISGGSGDDRLFGNKGNDKLDGNQGADRIYGNGGDDVISLGTRDTATGGKGSDTFIFTKGNAEITDFNPRHDHLELTGYELGDLSFHITDAGISIDFGGQNELTLDGVSSVNSLISSIDFV